MWDRFPIKIDNFDTRNKVGKEKPVMFEGVKLEVLSGQGSCQTHKELAEIFDVIREAISYCIVQFNSVSAQTKKR